MVDAGNVAGIITGIMKESIEDTGSVVAVDGKAMRSTVEKGKPHFCITGFNCILYRKQCCTGTGSHT